MAQYSKLEWSKSMQAGYFKDMADGKRTDTYYQLFPDAKRDPVLKEANADADDFQRERYWLALNSKAPSQWLSDHLQESQRLTGAVYVAIKVLSDQASTAEAKFFEWEKDARLGHDKDAKKPLSRQHPLCKLMHRPNNWDSRGMLLRRIVQQLCLTGSSLLWRIDDGMDMPRELWSIPTGAYQPVPISSKYPDGAYSIQTWFPGPLAYVPGITNPGGAIVSANNILVTRHPHPLVYNEGNSPLNACALPLDTIESIDRARFTKMRRGIYPSAIATLDGASKMPEKNELLRIRTMLNQAIGGPDKAGLPAVLAPGMKLEQWGSDKIEVGWVESWSQLISFVLSIFGVTKSLAFMSEEASYASLYASLMQFNLFTLTPLLNLICDALNHQLVEPFYGEDYCMELVPRPVHDEQQKEQQYVNDYEVGLRTIDEMRVARGLGKAPWGDGGERAQKGNNKKMEEDASSEPNAPNPKEVEEMKNSRPENKPGYGTRGENKSLADEKKGFNSTKGWVTTESGTHLLLGADGTIQAGPSQLEGRHIDSLKPSKPQTSQAPTSKPGSQTPAGGNKPQAAPKPQASQAPKPQASQAPKPQTATTAKPAEAPAAKPQTATGKPPNVSKQVSAPQKDALTKYADDSSTVNDVMRGNSDLPEKIQSRLKDQAKSISEAIKEHGDLPEPTTVYRGMGFDDKAKLDNFLSQMKTGQTVKMPGFVSTTTDKAVAKRFGENYKQGVSMEIVANRGINMAGISPFGEKEAELLLDHNSQFKVISVESRDGKTHIKMEQLK